MHRFFNVSNVAMVKSYVAHCMNGEDATISHPFTLSWLPGPIRLRYCLSLKINVVKFCLRQTNAVASDATHDIFVMIFQTDCRHQLSLKWFSGEVFSSGLGKNRLKFHLLSSRLLLKIFSWNTIHELSWNLKSLERLFPRGRLYFTDAIKVTS